MKKVTKKSNKKSLHNKRILSTIIILTIVMSIMAFSLTYTNSPMGITGFAIFTDQPDSTTGKDTYIIETANNNYATAPEIKIGTIGGLERRGLIEFNLSSIPSSDTIISAKLQIYVETIGGTGNRTISIHRLTSEWNETTTNWYNRTLSTAWTSEGGDYAEEINSITITNETGQYYNFTLTSAIQDWVNTTYNNYGMIIISDAGDGNYTYISSSNSVTPAQQPLLWVDHSANAAPIINAISINSNLTNLIQIGNDVTFTINWTDLESENAQTYICNSSDITFSGGCQDTEFCSTSLASTNPAECSYTTLNSDNRTTNFWVAVCDSTNCSTISSTDYFYVNHVPNITIIQPNGGETINQTQGNYDIQFNVSDADNEPLMANIYYGTTQGSTTNIINASLNLTTSCTDSDSDVSTTNNCVYSWNSSGVYGSYFLTIIVNDSYTTNSDSSDSQFDVISLIDDENPQIPEQWIESATIYSGRETQIYANITDDNLNYVWFEIDTASISDTIMTNTTALTYNASFTAPEIGTYNFKVYANDTIGNLNNSMPWQEFTVTKPSATAQNILAPSTSTPYTTIRISAELNATDPLRDVYAYLTVPDGFTFLSGYDQNTNSGNYSASETKTTTWFISTPITESDYILNVTYTDHYSNTWDTSNKNITITQSLDSRLFSASGYPEVETTGDYFTEGFFTNNGIPEDADSVTLKIYDSIGSLIVGPASMNNPETGTYNYSYTVGVSVNEGQWQTVLNATKNSITYLASEFWKVVGGPFDVRDITIDNSAIDALEISVITENTGGAIKDIIMVWNLTKESTGESIDSGSDTFAVNPSSTKTYTINPTTTFVGQSRITFLGTFSGTEKAGAFKIFSTTAAGTTPVTPPSGGGGGGGGGEIINETVTPTENASLLINFEKEITLTKNIKKTTKFEIENTGTTTLTNLTLTLEGLTDEYTLSPEIIDSIEPGKKAIFTIEFFITNFVGEKEFTYILKTNELTKQGDGKLIVLAIDEFFKKEIERLKNWAKELQEKTEDEKILEEINTCNVIINNLENNLEKEEFINAQDNLNKAENCLEEVEDNLEKGENFFEKIKMPNITITIIVIIALILACILIYFLYKIYKTLNVLTFFKKEDNREKPISNIKQVAFDTKLQKIESTLGIKTTTPVLKSSQKTDEELKKLEEKEPEAVKKEKPKEEKEPSEK